MNDAPYFELPHGGGASAYSRPRDTSRLHSLSDPLFSPRSLSCRDFTLSRPRARASEREYAILSHFLPVYPSASLLNSLRVGITEAVSLSHHAIFRYVYFNLIFII